MEREEPNWAIIMDDSFGNWIRKAMPKHTEDRVRSEVHLAILKERIRQGNALRKKRRAWNGLIAAPLLLAMVISLSVVDLGGDGFDLVEVEDSRVPGGVVKNEFRGVGFNIQNFESSEEIQEFNQQVAAGQGKVIGLEGWEIWEKTEWTIKKEFIVLGEIKKLGFPVINPPTISPPELPGFLIQYWDEFESQIRSGAIQPSGRLSQQLDGIMFSVQFWEIPTEKFGVVTYYSGKPIH